MKCLVDFCEKEGMSRGLCRSHYNHLYIINKRNLKISWDEMEKLGLCLASRKPRRGRFINWVESKIKK